MYMVTPKFLLTKLCVNVCASDCSCSGLKVLCVYGPQENHKDVWRPLLYASIQSRRLCTLVGGWDGYGNGEQQRDFVYIDDVVDVNLHFYSARFQAYLIVGQGGHNL